MKKEVIVLIGIMIVFMSCVFFAAIPSIPPGRFRTTVASKVKFVNSFADNSGYDLFEYYVGNKKYQDIGEEHMLWVTKGEKFLLKYDTLYPGGKEEHCHIVTEHPVFLPGEITSYTYGTLKKLGVKDQLFEFTYTILGKKYDRIQYLAFVDKVKNHPQLVNDADFLVEYWVKNPERAILYMDKPKTDKTLFALSPDIHVLRPVWDSIPVLLPNPQMIKSQPGWQ